MRGVIEDLMKLLNIDEKKAERVECDMQIDFSECSKRQFNVEARFCLDFIDGKFD